MARLHAFDECFGIVEDADRTGAEFESFRIDRSIDSHVKELEAYHALASVSRMAPPPLPRLGSIPSPEFNHERKEVSLAHIETNFMR